MATAVEVPEYEVQDDVQLDPERTALIVVDMQNDFVSEGGSLVGPDAKDTIPRIQSLLELARGSGMRVVYSQDTHDEGDPEWKIWPEHARRGLRSRAVRPRVVAAPDGVSVRRHDHHNRSHPHLTGLRLASPGQPVRDHVRGGRGQDERRGARARG